MLCCLEMTGWRRVGGADLGDLVVNLLHAGGESFGLPMATDVHKVDLWLIEEEVIVKRRDFEACFDCRVHLILKHDGVAHHGGLRGGMSRRERGPRRETHERRHGPLVDLDFDVSPWFGDLENALFGDQLSLDAGGLLNGGRVEIYPLRTTLHADNDERGAD